MYLDAIRKFSIYETPEEPDEELDDPIPEGGGGGEPTPIPGIDRTVLPEELRDLPEAEIKFHLGQMVSSLRRRNEDFNSLKDQLDELKRSTQKPAEPPKPDKPLEELILEDPEAAIETVLQKRGYVSRFSQLEDQVGESAFNVVASRVPGFSEYEEEVRKIIKDANAPKTVNHIMGALEMAVGRRTLVDKTREARKPHTPSIPKESAPKKSSKLPELQGLEREIFEASGMSRDDWEKHKNSDFEIEVPTS